MYYLPPAIVYKQRKTRHEKEIFIEKCSQNKKKMSVQMSVQSKRFVFPTLKMSIQVSIQMSVLSVFPTVQTVQISNSFFQMYYLGRVSH